MKNIVSELQRDVLDKEFDVESLLRKAYIIATKTKSLDFEKWVLCEQNGYDDSIPEYRRIEGKLLGVNFRNEEFEVTFTDRDMENPNCLHYIMKLKRGNWQWNVRHIIIKNYLKLVGKNVVLDWNLVKFNCILFFKV